MITPIIHALRVAHAVVREHAKLITRSSKWGSIRKAALKTYPQCACCGDTAHLQVHHQVPFHLHPELELDPKNLIVLCMGKNECHLLIGHGNNFKKYNPYIAADAMNICAGSETIEEVKTSAKKNAIFLPISLS